MRIAQVGIFDEVRQTKAILLNISIREQILRSKEEFGLRRQI